MFDELKIPPDMNHPEIAEKIGASAAIKLRDLLILLDAPDEVLRDYDKARGVDIEEGGD